jgi:hypothetical protein
MLCGVLTHSIATPQRTLSGDSYLMPPNMSNQPHSRSLSDDFARQQQFVRPTYVMQRSGSPNIPMMNPRMQHLPYRTHSPPIMHHQYGMQPIRQPIMQQQPVMQKQPVLQPTSQQKEAPKKTPSPFDNLNEFQFLNK